MNNIARFRRIFTVLTFLSILSFFHSIQAFAWTISRDFEGGAVGQTATGSNGFFWVNSNNIKFSDTNSYAGTKSVSALFPGGSADSTGATFEGNGATVSNGGEAWYRAYLYFPTGWRWNSITKVLRLAATQGNLSILSNGGQITASNEPAIYGGYDGQPGIQEGTGVNFDIGQWQCVEIYVKLSNVAGQGIIRIWKNGVRIYERTTLPTLASSSHSLVDVYTLFNYWNGGAPQTQTAYVDNIIITNSTPSNVDAYGNRMIGPTDWSGSSPPPYQEAKLPAPTGLRIE